MRKYKNNVTLSLENIISFSKNITSHFTGKEKIITLASLIIMLSFINIINTSALSYQSSVGVGFTFDPTLSVSISPSDLVISNLTPGTTGNSNIINVSVATNASYGYTLSAIVNSNNSNLTHSNGTNTFSSIATNADLSDLEDSEDDNIWGYSYKDNTVEIPTWSNYNGLSSSNSTTLINTNNNVSSNLDFKIAAKASNAQPSGTYTGAINFAAVSNVAPMGLLDSFIASGAEQLNGYFKMQDMTSDICNNVDNDLIPSELQLIDERDNKIYWVAKLKDGNCWMTQNLDLDIVAGSTNLTSNNTDLSTNENVYTASNTIYALKGVEDIYGYTYDNGVATWIPERTTIAYNQLNNINWQNSNTDPYSYDRLETSGVNISRPVYPDSNVPDEHGLAGNYYNWTASLASNDSINASASGDNPINSVCPKGWKLPNVTNKEFNNLLVDYNVITANSSTYVTDVNSMGVAPLYFVRGGYVYSSGSLRNSGIDGLYWSSTSRGTGNAFFLYYNSTDAFTVFYNTHNYFYKYYGRTVRCLAR